MKSLSLTKPHLLVMVGIPGSGKSFFAEKFAETFHAPCVSKNHIMSLGITNDLVARDVSHYQISELIKTNHTIIVDCDAESRTARAELSKIGKEANYEVLFIWVQIDQQSAKVRYVKTGKKEERAELAEKFDKQMARFSAPHAAEKILVISGKHTYASQAKIVLTKLSSARAAISTHTTPVARPGQTTRRNVIVR
jgi:predicted kinase